MTPLALLVTLALAEPTAAEDAPAPLDTEVPEPRGMSLQRREYRQIVELTGLDLAGAWGSYEDRVEDGLEDSFSIYLARRLRIRRNIGVAVTGWGIAMVGVSSYFWIETSRTELYEGQVALGFAAAAMTAIGLGATITGGVVWSRFGARLRLLKDTGVIASRPRLAPLALPRGGGLGIELAF